MTPDSHDLDDVDRLTVGTVGPPGQRTFFLQASGAAERLTLKVEKWQVAELVTVLEAILSDLPPPGPLPDDLDLEEPVEAAWVAGSLGVSYDEVDDRVVLVMEEAVPAEDERPGAVARLRATREQIAALAVRGTELVRAGRPPCPWCGQPLDPEGHVCPRSNGHVRLSR